MPTGVCVLYLDHFRTLGAHCYTNAGGEVTFVDQWLDSVNYPDSRFSSFVWAPVGLRFHALHHLFPTLPYHNLARAHRRLMALLPADSPYRETNSPGLVASLRRLWRLAGNPPQTSGLPPVETARPSDRFRGAAAARSLVTVAGRRSAATHDWRGIYCGSRREITPGAQNSATVVASHNAGGCRVGWT